MWTIIISVILSATMSVVLSTAIVIKIAAEVKRGFNEDVANIYEINAEQTKKIRKFLEEMINLNKT